MRTLSNNKSTQHAVATMSSTTVSAFARRDSSTELNGHIQDLPPELFRMVMDSTFATPSGVRYIDESYQVPPTLSVSADLRPGVATDYYAGPSVFCCKSWSVCTAWLLSLPPEHLYLLKEIRCDFEDIGPNQGHLVRELNLLRALIGFCEFGDRLEERGLFFGPGSVFKMCYKGVEVRQYPTFKATGQMTVKEMMSRK